VADWAIEPFARDHERAEFSCGRPTLDDFLRLRVTQYEKRGLGKTFVAVHPGAKAVIGYYTLAAGAVAFEHLPSEVARKFPKHPVPVVLLARLAVDQSAQGKGLGETLLLDALQRALDLSSGIGVYAIEVDALDDQAAAFYQRYGFSPLVDNPRHLYLPIATVEDLL
jgi:GNAT superfamily N-acetyltransferase